MLKTILIAGSLFLSNGDGNDAVNKQKLFGDVQKVEMINFLDDKNEVLTDTLDYNDPEYVKKVFLELYLQNLNLKGLGFKEYDEDYQNIRSSLEKAYNKKHGIDKKAFLKRFGKNYRYDQNRDRPFALIELLLTQKDKEKNDELWSILGQVTNDELNNAIGYEYEETKERFLYHIDYVLSGLYEFELKKLPNNTGIISIINPHGAFSFLGQDHLKLLYSLKKSSDRHLFMKYSDILYANYPEDVQDELTIFAQKESEGFLKYADMYFGVNKNHAKDLIYSASKNSQTEDIITILKSIKKSIVLPEDSERIKSLFDEIIKKSDANLLLQDIEILFSLNEDNAKDVLLEIANNFPKEVLQVLPKFVNKPRAENIIQSICRANPALVLQFSSSFEKEVWGKNILPIVYKQDSSLLFSYPEVFAGIDKEYTKGLRENIFANQSSEYILQHANKYAHVDQESAKNLVQETCKNDYYAMLEYCTQNKDLIDKEYFKQIIIANSEKFKFYGGLLEYIDGIAEVDHQFALDVMQKAIHDDPSRLLYYAEKCYAVDENITRRGIEKYHQYKVEEHPGDGYDHLTNIEKYYDLDEDWLIRTYAKHGSIFELYNYFLEKNIKKEKLQAYIFDNYPIEVFYRFWQSRFNENDFKKEHEDLSITISTSQKNKINNLFVGLKDKIIKVGSRDIKIDFNKYNHLNIIGGIIATQQRLHPNHNVFLEEYRVGKNLEMCLQIYQSTIQDFLEKGKKNLRIGQLDKLLRDKGNTTIFFIRANRKIDDHNGAFSNYNPKSVLKELGTMKEYSSSQGSYSPDYIISSIEKYISTHPDKNIIIHLGLHGGSDGTASFTGVTANWRMKEDFERLLNLVDKNKNIIVDLGSCTNGSKSDNFFDASVDNIFTDSGHHLGYSSSDSYFLKAGVGKPTPKDGETYDPAIHGNPDADIDGDGIVSYHDYIVWRLLNYNHTLTPTYYKDKDGKVIRIAMNSNLGSDDTAKG